MKLLPLLTLLISLPLFPQVPDSSSALFSLREAEFNFARASVMFGRNAAFADNLADESVIFTDRWITTGKQFWKDRNVLPVVLKWEPEYMDISDSRDFGISTGPWEAQEARPNSAILGTGYFLSVWKRQPGGVWKVILDAGSATPPKAAPVHTFSFPAGADKPVQNVVKRNEQDVINELAGTEKKILADWKKSPDVSTYLSFLSSNIRMQHSGHMPTTNIDTIKMWILRLDKNLIWTTSGIGAAASGDLGYTYGMISGSDNPAAPKGHYVRIWRRPGQGRWIIVLEMMNFDTP